MSVTDTLPPIPDYAPDIQRLIPLRLARQQPSQHLRLIQKLTDETIAIKLPGGALRDWPAFGPSSVLVMPLTLPDTSFHYYVVCDPGGYITASSYTHQAMYALELESYFPGCVRPFCTWDDPEEHPLIQHAMQRRDERDNAIRTRAAAARLSLGQDKQQSRHEAATKRQAAAAKANSLLGDL